ncbi:hypothetical protein P692DRAFT_20821280 [Suillus brevipes Sb2]|nr:hypothetical protein P692DRAFT_20821280 [Suillus brevipes Sb2]
MSSAFAFSGLSLSFLVPDYHPGIGCSPNARQILKAHTLHKATRASSAPNWHTLVYCYWHQLQGGLVVYRCHDVKGVKTERQFHIVRSYSISEAPPFLRFLDVGKADCIILTLSIAITPESNRTFIRAFEDSLFGRITAQSTSAKPWSVQYDHREILHTFRTEDSKSNQLWLPAPQGDLHVLRVQVLIVIVFDGDPSLRHGVLMRSGFQNRRRKTLAPLDIVWI